MKPVEIGRRRDPGWLQINGIVLDCFGGSGTALLACHRTGRRCAMIEIDPHYVDVAILRFEKAEASKRCSGDRVAVRGDARAPASRAGRQNEHRRRLRGRLRPASKHTQFKPGNRANPKGRGKGTKNLKTDLQEEISEKITIGEGESRMKLSKQRAMVKSMVARAIKGDQRAADRCFELLLKFFGTGEEGQRLVELSAEDEAILADFIARSRKENPMADRQRMLDAVVRKDFASFVAKVFQTVVPGQDYLPNWHIRAMAYELELVIRGERRKLIITLPPRMLKSICASVALPAWILGHDPTARIVCVSYSADLAENFARLSRQVMQSDWYRRVFPETRLSRQKQEMLDFVTTKGGYRFSTSVGGTLTGRGGNFIIIDDPLKPDEAMSEARREGVNEWFRTTLLSRLDNKQTGRIVVVMQSVHVEDLVGICLSPETGRSFACRRSRTWTRWSNRGE